MAKKKFTVEVTETLQRQVEVEASDEKEALNKVMDMYADEEIVLDYVDFVGNDFQVIKASPNNDECPYCHSHNIDFVDSDEDSTKYICRDCGEDFIVLEDGTITTRNGKIIRTDKEGK